MGRRGHRVSRARHPPARGREALRLIREQGLAADEAARRAMPGAWVEYRAEVRTALTERQDIELALSPAMETSSPSGNPHVTRCEARSRHRGRDRRRAQRRPLQSHTGRIRRSGP
jgi:hypothetical protein